MPLSLRSATAALLALPLAACISFGPKPPPTLMTLTPASPVAAGAAIATDDASAIAVAVPTVDPALNTQRVMVQDGPTGVAYLKGARWAAAPAELFHDLLAETIMARTGRVVPDRRLVASNPDTQLSGHLLAFGLDGPGHRAGVVFQATLVHAGKMAIETRRFAAWQPVSREDGPAVAGALNRAANRVALDVASWLGGPASTRPSAQ